MSTAAIPNGVSDWDFPGGRTYVNRAPVEHFPGAEFSINYPFAKWCQQCAVVA
jgi:hypothetical protein